MALACASKKFPERHYREVLTEVDDRWMHKVNDAVVFVGALYPGDLHRVSCVPQGQRRGADERFLENQILKNDWDKTYGVYIHAHALNQLYLRQKYPWRVHGLLRAALVLAGGYVFFAIFFLGHRYGRSLAAVLASTVVASCIVTGVILLFHVSLPWASLAALCMALLTGLALPRLLVVFKVRRLERLVVQCRQAALSWQDLGEILLLTPPTSGRPLAHLKQLARTPEEMEAWLHDVTKLVVEGKKAGSTQFQFIPAAFFESQRWLREGWEASTKHQDCIERADALEEDFVGTRLRRIRNLLAHKTEGLKYYVIKLGEEALQSLGGRFHLSEMSEPDYIRLQLTILDKVLDYVKALTAWLKSS